MQARCYAGGCRVQGNASFRGGPAGAGNTRWKYEVLTYEAAYGPPLFVGLPARRLFVRAVIDKDPLAVCLATSPPLEAEHG